MAAAVAIERSDVPTAEGLALRRAVFVDEQGVPEADELDGTDGGCAHWLLREDGRAVATLRAGVAGGVLKIARVATIGDARGRGHAARLMREAMVWGRSRGAARAVLSAQEAVVPWYAAFGFEARGAAYDDAGIPHRDMEADLDGPSP